MNEREKVNLIREDGSEHVAEILMNIHLDSTGKDYVIYTLNEKKENGNIVDYAATVKVENGVEIYDGIDTEEEWTEIKKVMKETIKNGQQNSN